jgi:hypothetical protein
MNQREPVAIEASVTYSGTWGNHTVRYWHQTPKYWRAEQDGQVILMTCDDGWIYHDEAWPIQMLATPPVVCRLAGAGSLRPDSQPVTMLGRAAMRYELDPHGTMTVDEATGFVLEVHAESHLVTEAFTVPDVIDPAVFGETALNTSWEGFYSGYLL